jgi:hypothetical protein
MFFQESNYYRRQSHTVRHLFWFCHNEESLWTYTYHDKCFNCELRIPIKTSQIIYTTILVTKDIVAA